MKNKKLKIKSILIALLITITHVFSFSTNIFANEDYDYSNPIYSEGIDDTFVYDSNDSIVTTKKDIKRTLPEVTGLYDIEKYPIPLKNNVSDKETFELVKKENKEIMDRVEEDIKNNTLKKHKAADGQFYGSVPDDALGVEKKIYLNTNIKGEHSLASYVPAGEIATVTLNDNALSYAKKGKIKINVGMTLVDALDYEHNKSDENRMPYLGKTFKISQLETKVGTPFGGMISIEIDESVPSGLNIEVNVSGVVDTPYYDLGKTTYKEWQESKNAPGIFAEIRTPYLRFIAPAKFIREIDNPKDALLFWTNVASLSSYVMNQQYRTKPMTLIFDQYITAGIAYALVGNWTCNLPPSWITSSLNYDDLMKSGSWGIIHEINHHYQGRHTKYAGDWGLGDDIGEITNNVLSSISYILYTNIASYRGESGTDDWNKVVDPYSSLKQQIFESDEYYKDKPNMGNFMYSTFIHEIGPINFANVIKSTYDGATFNEVNIPAYDYTSEADGKKSKNDRYDDLAYRICVASERDYTWYMQKELSWPIKSETIKKIKSHGYKQVIPVQSVYGVGELGRETGRPYYVPSTGYTFNFEKSLVSPGKASVISVSKPKYGTLTKTSDGKYEYKPDSSMPKNEVDEFVLSVSVEADGIYYETKLNCRIALNYNSSNVEKFEITKWDIHEALDALKTATPYAISSSDGMKIYSDDGNNLARGKGFFILDEPGEYEFQAFGDDRAVFEINLNDETTLQSLTEDYSNNADDAYKLNGSTNFTVNLEANKAYPYTIIANNNGGLGWADVNIRKKSNNGYGAWKSINKVYANLKDVGKNTDRNFTMPNPEYVRPPILSGGNEVIVKNMQVISNPQGVDPNKSESAHEADPNNMIDGDLNTYFHSDYSDNRTPFPHEYIFDLGGEKSFNNLEIYTRSYDPVGVIGDYEIYVTDEYSNNAQWTKIAENHERKGNFNTPQDLKISLPETSAKYLKIKALNNRDDYNITIISEVKLSTKSNVKNVIAQNSSLIQYNGNWIKDTNGAYVNGSTYNSTDGYFKYCFDGSESNIYVVKDVEVDIRINGDKWERKKLTGSLREPSLTLDMGKEGKYVVEVRAIGQEVALNMLSTDGIFYKGKTPDESKPPVIEGATDLEIGIGNLATLDKKSGITVSYDNDILTLDNVTISGEIEKPKPGENKVSELTYSVEDSNKNITTVKRKITVTNQFPEISGLDDINIKKGTKFNLRESVIATDYEDKDITSDVAILSITKKTLPYEDTIGDTSQDENAEHEKNDETDLLDIGTYEVIYSVEDSDKNTTTKVRILNIINPSSSIINESTNIKIGVGQ